MLSIIPGYGPLPVNIFHQLAVYLTNFLLLLVMKNYKAMAFSGINEDFPAWSRRITAYSQTKDFYEAFVRKEAEPEVLVKN